MAGAQSLAPTQGQPLALALELALPRVLWTKMPLLLGLVKAMVQLWF